MGGLARWPEDTHSFRSLHRCHTTSIKIESNIALDDLWTRFLDHNHHSMVVSWKFGTSTCQPHLSEDFEPNFPTENTAQQQVVEGLVHMGAERAVTVVWHAMTLKAFRSPAPAMEHQPKGRNNTCLGPWSSIAAWLLSVFKPLDLHRRYP
jgi:hypothetical protein